MAFLEINDLVVKYGEIAALKGITLKAEEGTFTLYLGAG